MKKAYAIVWSESAHPNILKALKTKAGSVVSIHLEKPVVSLEMLWEVKEIEFKIK